MGTREGMRTELATVLRRWGLQILLLALFGGNARIPVLAQKPAPQPHESGRKIFVDSFQGKLGAGQLREKVLTRLRASGDVQVVSQASEADLMVHGSGETWLKGYISTNPHNAAGAREAVYGGYLSLEVENKSGEVLWSYLVTPSRMHWSGVDEDMADHIVRLMLPALKHASATVAQPASAPREQIVLAGAGSTFSAPLYQAWIDSFAEQRPEVHATYRAVGSEDGIRLLEEGKIDFAASDAPLSDEQVASFPFKIQQYTTVLGGIVPAYNLPGAGRDLQFTPEILAEIYLGKITKWNDPKLRAINHRANLPDQPIMVLHRSDGSGTSFAWTEFLSKASPEWKASAGSGMRVTWPTGEGVAGNEGVAAKIAGTPGAFGYVELTYAIRHELSFGLVRNAAGRFVQANLATLSDAAMAASAHGDLRAAPVDASSSDAYPITTFTWILIPTATEGSPKNVTLADLLRWMLTEGQKECGGLGYVPLPKNVAEKELAQAGATAGDPIHR